MMPYYLVYRIGGRTASNKLQPDVDVDLGIPYVPIYGNNNRAVVFTPSTLSPKAGRVQLPPVQQLIDACAAHGIKYEDVMSMYVKG